MRTDKPAFPLSWIQKDNNGIDRPQHAKGMPTRTLLAGMIMSGLLSDPSRSGPMESYARRAVAAADALLDELEKPSRTATEVE